MHRPFLEKFLMVKECQHKCKAVKTRISMKGVMEKKKEKKNEKHKNVKVKMRRLVSMKG